MLDILIKRNTRAISPITIILIVFVMLSVLFIVISLTMDKTPSCNVEDQQQITGILRGFNRNGSSYYDVTIGNATYVFCYILEQSYLEKFLGKPVIISYCENYDKLRDVKTCFDMCKCVLMEEN